MIEKMKEKRIIIEPKIPERKTPLIIGGVRNEHGTRISRKVTCEKCKQVDYVSVSRAKKGDGLFCRNCAKNEIGAFEEGTRIKPEMALVSCAQCAKPFDFPKWIHKQGPLMCSDCHKGFEVWQGSLHTPLDERSSNILQRRPAGTVLRKKASLD